MISRYYTLFLISFIAIAFSTAAQPADDRYRVEILVLLHLQHAQPGEETERPRDYSESLDFLTPLPEPEPLPPECEPAEEETPATAFVDTSGAIAGDESDDTAVEEETIDPNAVIHITEMGPEMQEAWRRLRLSGPFRPLQYLAWEQGSAEPFPTLRVHDDAVVLEDDPYADLREAEDELEAMYGDEPGMKTNIDEEPDCTPPEEDALPGPKLYYALDGATSLVRSRFLHLDLNLQLREPLALHGSLNGGQPTHALLPGAVEGGAASLDMLPPPPPVFRVHELEQRRQVRSGRMEYFDSPVLGVLAWITTIPLEAEGER